MSETKIEFLKRKKSEKRRQAEKQVREAYSQCIDVTRDTPEVINDFDEDGKIVSSNKVKLLKIGDTYIEWPIIMEPEIEDIYSTYDVCKALVMPKERLRDWMVRGFIMPNLPATRKGTISIFTRAGVKLVLLFSKLVKIGYKRELAAEHIKQISDMNVINSMPFIVLKYSIRDNEPAIDMLTFLGAETLSVQIALDEKVYFNKTPLIDNNDWEGIHVINMKNLDRELDKALERL